MNARSPFFFLIHSSNSPCDVVPSAKKLKDPPGLHHAKPPCAKGRVELYNLHWWYSKVKEPVLTLD
jgi:hypothetical protein